ncbi:MAG: glycosyltransferase family 2 protein [Propionibacteriaceae bacterium]|nr:glycosyltransferase family 2 protein [Propionibacteriaceae bacterium]
MTNKVAFCVVAWNNADVLPVCLESLQAQSGVDFDIYLLDNGSSDSTRTVLADYPHVKVTWSSTNHGFARGNNILIRQALDDPNVQYVALINSDATLDPAWASSLVDFAESHANVGSLQGLTLDYFNHAVVDSTHIFVNSFLHPQQQGFGEPRKPPGGYYPLKVFGVNAAACMYTRTMIESLPDRQHGFFDERFFMYVEDADVSYRALICGWDSWFVPDAIAYHMGSTSTKKRGSEYSLKMIGRNLPAMVYKNTPRGVFRRSIPHVGLGLIKLLRVYAERNGIKAPVMFTLALLRGFTRIPRFTASRRQIMAAKSIEDDYLMRIFRQDGVLG